MTSIHRLYRAQAAAVQMLETRVFPCYSPRYVANQGGVIALYSGVYNLADSAVCAVSRGAQRIHNCAQEVFQKASTLIPPVRWVYDAVCPINQINGKRRFLFVSKTVEKWLGDFVIYPLHTRGVVLTSACISGTDERIAGRVTGVIDRLRQSNQQLLNPDNEIPFNYRAKTIASSQMNAFAVPGGGMVVCRGIVEEMEAAMRSREFEYTQVTLADGSVVTVDLRGLGLNDALATLIGHEMTHAASRHSMMGLCSKLVTYVVLSLVRVVAMIQLKKQRAEEEGSDVVLDQLDLLLGWMQEKMESLLDLLRSKTCEYEADTTGAYLAGQAGFNPLGALWLQTFLLEKTRNEFSDFFHKHFECLYTHPYGENRKRALLGALVELAPADLRGRMRIDSSQADTCYDVSRSSPAIQATEHFRTRLLVG